LYELSDQKKREINELDTVLMVVLLNPFRRMGKGGMEELHNTRLGTLAAE